MMENRLTLILSLFIVTAEVVLTKSLDNHKRVERSPCSTCGGDGPPFGPLPPPGYFRAHQWSGLARNGDQHGVFSGASAAIGGRPQAGGEAISLAATGDDSLNGGYGGWGARLGGYNAGANSQSSRSSQSMTFGGQGSSSAGSSAYSGAAGGLSSAKSESSSGFIGQSTAGAQSQSLNGFDGVSSGGHGGNFGAGQSGRYSHSAGFHEESFKANRKGGNLDQPLAAGTNFQASNSYGSQSSGFQDGNFDGRHNGHHAHHYHSSNLNEQSFGSKSQSGAFSGLPTEGANIQSSNNFDAQSSKSYGDGFGRGDVGGSSYHNHQKSLANFGEVSSAGSGSFGKDQSSAGFGLHSSNAGGFEGHSSSQSLRGYGGFNAQNSNGFGGSSSSDASKLGGGSNNYAYQEFQSSQSGKLDAIGHINSDSSGHGYLGSQQQSKDVGFGQQQSVGLGSSGLSAGSANVAGGYDANSNGDSYYKSQSALKGALNLASQGIEAGAQNAGCSTCGKGSYALSNARSESGNAVAVSVSG